MNSSHPLIKTLCEVCKSQDDRESYILPICMTISMFGMHRLKYYCYREDMIDVYDFVMDWNNVWLSLVTNGQRSIRADDAGNIFKKAVKHSVNSIYRNTTADLKFHIFAEFCKYDIIGGKYAREEILSIGYPYNYVGDKDYTSECSGSAIVCFIYEKKKLVISANNEYYFERNGKNIETGAETAWKFLKKKYAYTIPPLPVLTRQNYRDLCIVAGK